MPVKFGKTIIRFWFFLSYLITTVPRLCYVPKHRNRTLMTFLKPPGTNSRHISKITKSVPNKHFEMLLETKSSIIHEFPQNFPKYKKYFQISSGTKRRNGRRDTTEQLGQFWPPQPTAWPSHRRPLRFGFCVSNFFLILPDFISREKLTKK